jgi:hypothetical protein
MRKPSIRDSLRLFALVALLGAATAAPAATADRSIVQLAAGICAANNPANEPSLRRLPSGLKNATTSNVSVVCAQWGDDDTAAAMASATIGFKNEKTSGYSVTCTLSAGTPLHGQVASTKSLYLAGGATGAITWTTADYGTGPDMQWLNAQCSLPGGWKMQEVGFAYAEDVDAPVSPNLMFTTSATYDGNLGGLAGADAKCQALATNAGLAGTYRAYLGATGVNAPSRFAGASGWTRVDGQPIVNQIGEFGTVVLANPPSLDQSGNDLTNSAQLRVWTATNSDTTYTGQNCNSVAGDWSTTSSRTMSGVLTATNSNVLTGGNVLACATLLHLYCFGIDRAATVP